MRFNSFMRFENLKAFCDVVETKSFIKAAHINGITGSAVSQMITALERHFKSLLIERSIRNLRLTREGEVLYDYSKQLLQSYEVIQSKMRELQGKAAGGAGIQNRNRSNSQAKQRSNRGAKKEPTTGELSF